MTIATQPVTIRLADFGGDSAAGVKVIAKLSDFDYTADGVFVSTEPVEGFTDADGLVVLQLFPNALTTNGGLGTRGTVVRVKARISGSKAVDVNAVIPNEPCNLVDHIVNQEPGGLSASEAAAASAQGSRNAAAASAEAALASQNAADESEQNAAASAVIADQLAPHVSTTAPADPVERMTWFNPDTGKTYIFFDDGETQQWVEDSAFYYVDDPVSVLEAQEAAAAAAASEIAVDADAALALTSRLSADESAALARGHSLRSVQALARINELLPEVAIDRDTFVSELMQDHLVGMSIDFTEADDTLAVQVVDTTTPANNYLGPVYGFMAAATFPSAKLCKQSDGTFEYQPHNECIRSDDPSNASWTKQNCTPTAGQVGPDGVTTDASLLTSTASTTSWITLNITVLANQHRRLGFVVKNGNVGWAYLETVDTAVTKRAYVNLATGVLGTVDAGITAYTDTNDEFGVPYPAGWYFIGLAQKTVGTSVTVKLGLCNADASTTVTTAKTMYVARAQSHRGLIRLPYLKTTTVSVRGTPVDWTQGESCLRLDVATAYRGRWGDDWTNAVWTASGITAALNATGPHGEPCSSITATAPAGTISQAVTSAGTVQLPHLYIRRKTGTGTIEMSINGGANYTDITALIGAAGGTYNLVKIRGALANPTVVFRIGTSGDAFEVALFNVSSTWHTPPPMPAAAIDGSIVADAFSIPTTAFPFGAAMSVYADLIYPVDGIGAASLRTKVGFFGAASAVTAAELNVLSTGKVRLEHNTHDGTARLLNFGNLDTGGRFQCALRTKANDYAAAYNGNVPYHSLLPNLITYTSFQVTTNQSVWVRRLLVVPEAIADDDLRTWHLDTEGDNVNTSLLDSSFVYKYGTTAGTTLSRIPSVEVLYERGDVCGFICVWGSRNVTGYHAEHPQRIRRRRGEFDRSTNQITWLEADGSVYEDPRWAGGLGGTQGYTLFKLKTGPFRGRLGLVYVQQDSVTGMSATDDARNLYIKYSDDNGTTWSAGVKILDKVTFIGATKGFLSTGENSTSVQLVDGPQEGRVYLSLNVNNQSAGVMWTDDFKTGGNGTGATWSYTTTRAALTGHAFGTLSEPAVAMWPGDQIVLTFRNTGGGNNAFAVSTDYGVTFTVPVVMAGDNTSATVNVGFLQDDPTGQRGRYGRLIYARSQLASDTGHKVQSANDAAMTLGNNYSLFPAERNVGYCPFKKAFVNDNIYLLMGEHQPALAANVETSQMLTAFRY